MGRLPEYDGGVHLLRRRIHQLLAYPDHGIVYRFVPQSVDRTEMEVLWLVRGDAEPGRDHDSARLRWLWQLTSQADKRIIELNQKGIRSRFYEPGPYSRMEQHAARFTEWLLTVLR